jgi:hypothetical protein
MRRLVNKRSRASVGLRDSLAKYSEKTRRYSSGLTPRLGRHVGSKRRERETKHSHQRASTLEASGAVAGAWCVVRTWVLGQDVPARRVSCKDAGG